VLSDSSIFAGDTVLSCGDSVRIDHCIVHDRTEYSMFRSAAEAVDDAIDDGIALTSKKARRRRRRGN